MAITQGNPIIITSGTGATLINGPMDNIKVDRLYWHQPSLSSTSSLVLRKRNNAGPVLAVMTCETSGQSQVLELKRWANNIFVDMMPTGTLYIHKK